MDLLPWGNFYLTFPLKDNKTEVERLIDIYNNTLTELHGMGARKFGIINVGLIAHLPAMQMSRYSSESSGLNRRAAEFNAALETCLSNLSTKLYRFRCSLTDFYGFSNSIFANPMATGFRDTKNACCTGLCAPYTYDDVCSNRMDYWFWDDLYTTEKAAKLAATAFYSGKAFTAPVNIKRLIAMNG
nr:unnamed protein product [Digitaria exilis]